MLSLRATIFIALLLMATTPVRARVLIEWTEPAIPSALSLGVKDLVIPWGPSKIQLMKTARDRGYRVFTEATAQDAAAAAKTAALLGLAGIIVESGTSGPDPRTPRELLGRLRSAHPALSVLKLDSGGKEPQIRGNLVQKSHGVLVVSSPTQEPWIDSNVALVRFERAFQPKQPPLFSFSWDSLDPLEQQQGPPAENYALAVAEAGAMHADVILPVHPSLQQGLAEGGKAAWREWERVKTYIAFYSIESSRNPQPVAEVVVVTDHYQKAYETMNLLARRNITFRVLAPDEVTAQWLGGARLVLLFSQPGTSASRALESFAWAGGTVMLVDQHGQFPWQGLPAEKTPNGVTYKVGHGEIMESSQPVGDPDGFAEKVRNLLHRQGLLVYVWNAVTTLAFACHAPHSDGMVLDLVNYAQEPLQVQVRVKGSFPNIRYETPEHGFYPAVQAGSERGFTQFVVSHLIIGARVYLKPKEEQPH